ncbi:hypothetical protein [Methanimicrococcus hongohii]|uniref:hypothetical protein n=1 Tax=Methanimicrococcus hongohii TaxID=3028295 RepID=UPI00292D387F|nr:hypothetical protein [Methanimicrococcus sp. Hf6]
MQILLVTDLRSASHKISSGRGRAVFVKNRFAIFQASLVCSWREVFVSDWREVFVSDWREVSVSDWREVSVSDWREVSVSDWREVFIEKIAARFFLRMAPPARPAAFSKRYEKIGCVSQKNMKIIDRRLSKRYEK